MGTLYKQVSPFEARKLGAVLVARNIAHHVEQQFCSQPKHWAPLVYCWRSGAMQIILRQIGWHALRLEGGYKAFRRLVIDDTAKRTPRLKWHVLCAATGSGKTRILQQIAAQGGQALDLETLAAHKGSVLGRLPTRAQPAQKAFETAIWHQLSQFDPQKPVFIEAESRKIGLLQVPEALICAIREGTCIALQAPVEQRLAFLVRDYDYFLQEPQHMLTQLDRLKERHGCQTIARWQKLVEQQQWAILVHELLVQHYDPLYRQSHRQMGTQAPLVLDDLSAAGIQSAARRILQQFA